MGQLQRVALRAGNHMTGSDAQIESAASVATDSRYFSFWQSTHGSGASFQSCELTSFHEQRNPTWINRLGRAGAIAFIPVLSTLRTQALAVGATQR